MGRHVFKEEVNMTKNGKKLSYYCNCKSGSEADEPGAFRQVETVDDACVHCGYYAVVQASNAVAQANHNKVQSSNAGVQSSNAVAQKSKRFKDGRGDEADEEFVLHLDYVKL